MVGDGHIRRASYRGMSTAFVIDDLFLSLQSALAGRYSLDRELGRGGMGVVYLAREVRLDRLVAIKVLPPLTANSAARDRFVREARIAARLSHPHIIPIHAVEQEGEFVFYVMPWIDGESLGQRVARGGPLSVAEGTRLLREVAWAIGYAHAQGVVHRDIKPDNILIDRESGRAIVADFGIAAGVGDVVEGGGGTPEFMSPEQALGHAVDARSDLYSLGVSAWFAFAGHAPFTGPDPRAIILQHLEAPVPPLPRGLPRQVAQLVTQCMAKAPADRPGAAQDVAAALAEVLERRRDVPAVLRAFVKRDGRTDGAGTMATLTGALVGGTALSTVTSDVTGVLVMIGSVAVAGVAFGITQAHRLVRRGFRHGDLAPAFVGEQDSLREERAGTTHPVLRGLTRVLRALATFGVTLTALLLPFATFGGRDLDLVPKLALFCAGATLLTTLAWLVALQTQRDIDVRFWRRVWTGRAGTLAFAIARRWIGNTPVAASMTHRATELSLGLAAEQLYESLPRDVRDSLRGIPGALADLQRSAETLRAQCADAHAAHAVAQRHGDIDAASALADEKERVAARHRDAVAALETLRLNLLRLHMGQLSVEGVTTQVTHAIELADDIRRLVEARREVDDIFGAVHAA
jgi:eukaryotic-like serine/threonine-protein kinase